MASLNEIATHFAASLKKQFDYAFIERVKFAFKKYRATLIRQGETFRFVGGIDINKRLSFIESNTSELAYTKEAKYIKNEPKYVYINGYIYVYTNGKFKFIRIEAVFADPDKVQSSCEDICVDDDVEFPVSDDMIGTIYKMMLANEFSIPNESSEEIKLDTEYESK